MWWRYFDMLLSEDEDLELDLDCLANAVKTGNESPVKRSIAYEYKFDKFQEELHKFFKDVDNHYENNDFDISSVFKEELCPYAQVDQNGKFHNIKPEFTNIFKALS